MSKFFNKIKGDKGEKLAAKYLKKHKYKILETNFSNSIGEIDIIAKKSGIIVFVEVKFRETDRFGLPREAVTEYKQNKIRKVAEGYLKYHKLLDSDVRFDVIEILDKKLEHLENCF